MGCGPLGSARVCFNMTLRRLLPPNVNPKTQERWQPPPVSLTGVTAASLSLLGASLLVQMVGHDALAMYVLGPGCTVHLPQTTLCCGVSGRPCCKPNLPTEPVSEVPMQACQELPLPMTLCFSMVGLTYGEPEDDLYEQFEFSSFFFFCLTVLNEHEYDNIRPCRKVLIMLFGVKLSSMIIFDSVAPLWPWIRRWAWQGQTVIHALFRIFRELVLVIKEVKTEYFYNSWTFEAESFWLHLFASLCVQCVLLHLITSPVRITSAILLAPTWTADDEKRGTEEEGDRRRTIQRSLGLTPESKRGTDPDTWSKSSMTKNSITGRDVLSPLTFCNLAADAQNIKNLR